MTDSYIYPNWDAPQNIGAVFTTRAGGVSHKPFDSFNLAAHVNDCEDDVQKNRDRLLHDHKLESIYWLNQIHGVRVVRVDSVQSEVAPAADASFSKTPGIGSAVMVADCMPVLVTDKAGSIVGAAHAGWRGLCSGVIPELLSSMQIEPEQTLVWLGPCIGPDLFEVGPEVLESFSTSKSFASIDINAAFQKTHSDRYLCDLHELAIMQLSNMGVINVSRTQNCTHKNAGQYFSYRRDVTSKGSQGETGRMAALIWINHL